MKFNPFRPNSIVGPGMFAGRIEEIETIERCLFQTKHGNPQHFLIQGERGIGKSSLLMVVDNLAAGRWTPLNTEKKFDFLTVSVDIGGAEHQLDVVAAIARGLRREINKRDIVKVRAAKVWDFLSNW